MPAAPRWRRVRVHRMFGVFVVGLLLAAAIAGNAVCFYVFDGAENSELTAGDAIWYSVIE